MIRAVKIELHTKHSTSVHGESGEFLALAHTITRHGSVLDLLNPAPLSREQAYRLIGCRDDEVPSLLDAAVRAKERFKPEIITYSRKVFIPLTNLCRDYCGYCIFRRDPGEPGAHTMTPDEVLEVARAGEKLGCTEALFSLA